MLCINKVMSSFYNIDLDQFSGIVIEQKVSEMIPNGPSISETAKHILNISPAQMTIQPGSYRDTMVGLSFLTATVGIVCVIGYVVYKSYQPCTCGRCRNCKDAW